jgi:hypothetical protein
LDIQIRLHLVVGHSFSRYVSHRPGTSINAGVAGVGKVLGLLENWRGASFADVNQQTGFGEPGKGAPHGNENTGFAAHT